MTTFSDTKPHLVDMLTHFELRVLARLEQRLDYGNWIPVMGDELAEEMGTDKANVSRAFKGLMSKGVIERSRPHKNGRTWSYRLNADYGWRGDAVDWHRHQRERHKQGEVVQLFPVGSEEQHKSQGGDAIDRRQTDLFTS